MRKPDMHIDLAYPGIDDNPERVVINLPHVTPIRISFDLGRDGWSIQHQTQASWESIEENWRPTYEEKAFVKSFPWEKYNA